MTPTLDRSILPLDLNSMIDLLDSPGGAYAPLSFKMHQPTPDVTEIHLNIEDCDPDSITIGVFNGEVQVEASAMVHIHLGPSGPTRLSRPVTTSIPLAPGIHSDMIHSNIDDGTLVLTIPMGG